VHCKEFLTLFFVVGDAVSCWMLLCPCCSFIGRFFEFSFRRSGRAQTRRQEFLFAYKHIEIIISG
jgi:hypothetical protein